MKRWSDYKGEDAIDLLADVIEPLVTILTDDDIKALTQKKDATRLSYVTVALKKHKTEVLKIMARVADMPVDEYAETVNALTLPLQILDILNDPNINSLFTLRGQTGLSVNSGSAMENTKAEKN